MADPPGSGRAHSIVVFGASGFTGKYVVQELLKSSADATFGWVGTQGRAGGDWVWPARQVGPALPRGNAHAALLMLVLVAASEVVTCCAVLSCLPTWRISRSACRACSCSVPAPSGCTDIHKIHQIHQIHQIHRSPL